MRTKDYQRRIRALKYTVKTLMPKIPYHNFNHALDVCSAVNTLALLDKVNYKNRFLLKTAALLHDIIFIPGAKDNEEKSAEFAKQYLTRIGYSAQEAQKVGQLILATKIPQNPKNYLEKSLCDADLDNLGRADCFDQREKVRLEFNAPKNREWYQQILQLLENHKYHTKVARKLRNKGKHLNIQKLKRILQEGKC